MHKVSKMLPGDMSLSALPVHKQEQDVKQNKPETRARVQPRAKQAARADHEWDMKNCGRQGSQ